MGENGVLAKSMRIISAVPQNVEMFKVLTLL